MTQRDVMHWAKMVESNQLDLDEADKDIGGEKYDGSDRFSGGLKLWVDDLREPPEGFLWFKTTKSVLDFLEWNGSKAVSLFDLDHDAGDFVSEGGDYVRILDFLDFSGAKDVIVHIHSANPVGANNMRRIITKNSENGWKEVRNS